mmetsp:Transcript_97048/g.302606  ORF Transcript_97048/g.302606 Transcript_97048/m.302606 type:complete len:258 (-) Transcript_97048:521-1294(-)
MRVDDPAVSEAGPAELVPAVCAGHVVARLVVQLLDARPAARAPLHAQGYEETRRVLRIGERGGPAGRRTALVTLVLHGHAAGKGRGGRRPHALGGRQHRAAPALATAELQPRGLLAAHDVRVRRASALNAELVPASGAVRALAAAGRQVVAFVCVEPLAALRAHSHAVVGPEGQVEVALELVEAEYSLSSHRLDLLVAVGTARHQALLQLLASTAGGAVRAVEVHPAEGLPRRQFERLDADRATARWNERRWWRRWG